MKKINSKITVQSGTPNSISADRKSNWKKPSINIVDAKKQNDTRNEKGLQILSQSSVESVQCYTDIEQPDFSKIKSINEPSPTRLKK